jgi:hypothetical protein
MLIERALQDVYSFNSLVQSTLTKIELYRFFRIADCGSKVACVAIASK